MIAPAGPLVNVLEQEARKCPSAQLALMSPEFNGRESFTPRLAAPRRGRYARL
ncbi:MAG: hypothetical protein WAW17_29115 [Rhodococcus sp. (in: high G+C Gram-positive bacteria)]|uniref:hypothetical protein n=1 Tax=Rhodococcus sp. TaxID=1831 RepID=UPI003BB11CFF